MIRLFVALEIPENLSLRLAGLHTPLPRSRWVSPENMHITIRFIGEVSHGDADDIADMLSRISMPAFDATVTGIGMFGSRGRVRALWAGVEKSPALNRLHAKVDAACQRAGLPPEGRKFRPHVTLVRCRDIRDDQARPFLNMFDGFHGGAIRVGEFVLYSSRLGHDGPVYTREMRFPLESDAEGLLSEDDRFAELAAEWSED